MELFSTQSRIRVRSRGGLVQGIGFGVMEDLCVQVGRVLALNLGDYKIPSMKDIPKLATVLVQNPAGPVPYQGKAIGEISNVAIAAAIANAVCDATGVRLFGLPLTAEKNYFELKKSSRGDNHLAQTTIETSRD